MTCTRRSRRWPDERPGQGAPKVDLDATVERLVRLGIGHGAEHLADCLAHSAKAELPAHAFLDRLLDIELNEREERRVKTSLRLSGLPTGQTLASFDFAFQPSVERSQIETLATCAWVRGKETLLIHGLPGVGKTHLSVALGVMALENGFSVTSYRLEEFLAALRADAELPPARLRRSTSGERSSRFASSATADSSRFRTPIPFHSDH